MLTLPKAHGQIIILCSRSKYGWKINVRLVIHDQGIVLKMIIIVIVIILYIIDTFDSWV